MNLYFIRHGQTTANLAKIFAGNTDVMLTPQGREEALSIRPILSEIPFDKVYTSNLTRAMETQKLALPDYASVQTPLLQEIDEGELVGISIPEAVARYGDDFLRTRDYTRFHGENAEMVCQRLRKFLSELEKDPCENVAAFAHVGIMNCMMRIVLGTECNSTAMPSPNCAIHVFHFDGKNWSLLAWNYMRKI